MMQVPARVQVDGSKDPGQCTRIVGMACSHRLFSLRSRKIVKSSNQFLTYVLPLASSPTNKNAPRHFCVLSPILLIIMYLFPISHNNKISTKTQRPARSASTVCACPFPLSAFRFSRFLGSPSRGLHRCVACNIVSGGDVAYRY